MSHINVNLPSVTAAQRKSLRLDSFSGGVSFCNFSGQLRDGQSPYMKNLMYSKNLLRTRFGQAQTAGGAAIPGELHSKCDSIFFGYYVFHIGTVLCAFDGENVKTLSEELPDCDSFIFEMNSQLYIFCMAARIFILDKALSLVEYTLPTVKVYENAKYNLTEFTECEVPDDMLIGRVSVSYKASNSGFEYFQLPTKCDADLEVKIVADVGKILKKDEFTINGDRIDLAQKQYLEYTVTYTPAVGEKYRNYDKIFGCTTTVCYGGTQSGGTRVFFSGNKDYPGYYFYSELLSPLTIHKLSYDIIGNGSENINRFAKQKGDLIALCDRSVYRISYSFNVTDGPDFTVSEISTMIGCDMPGSVQLVDNRLVFANSQSGVYIIVSSDYTDELSIRSISANINGTGNGTGLLSESEADLKSCISADYGRKYYLFVGGCGYVWDYGNTAYIVSSDPINSERRLAWFYLEGLYENSLFEIGELYGTYPEDGKVKFALLSEDTETDFGKVIQCEYQTQEFDLSCAEAKKVLYEIYLNALKSSGADITVTVSGDGCEIRSEAFSVKASGSAEKEMLHRIFMKVPGYEAYRFSVKLQSRGGVLGIYDLVMRFRSDKILYR